MPDALISAQPRSVWLRRALALGLGLVLAADPALAQDGRTSFDIPAQPLATALEAFSTASGYQILMADPGAGTIRSNAINGVHPSRDALLQMVAGTGLKVRFTAAQAAVLVPDVRSEGTPTPGPQRRDQERYEAALQNDVMLALCRDAATRPGQYRTALDLWVGSSGRIYRAELLGSTGDPVRDKRIVAVLLALASAPPPPGLARPTTLLFLPKPSDSARMCDVASPEFQRATIR